MSERMVKVYQKIINFVGKVIGFEEPLNEKEFKEIDTGHFVSVDKYLEKQRAEQREELKQGGGK